MFTLGPRRPNHDVVQEFAIDLSFECDNLLVLVTIKKQSKLAKYQSNYLVLTDFKKGKVTKYSTVYFIMNVLRSPSIRQLWSDIKNLLFIHIQ